MYSILEALKETVAIHVKYLAQEDAAVIEKEVSELNARAEAAGLVYRITVDQVCSSDLESALVPDNSENDEDYGYNFSDEVEDGGVNDEQE